MRKTGGSLREYSRARGNVIRPNTKKKTARRNNNHPSFTIPASFVSPLNRVAASVAED